MKSFADWTDEIRALMNPPAPMVDTCNLSAVELGTAIHTAWEKRLEDWPKTVGFDPAHGEDYSATAIAKKRDRLASMYGAGRQAGKSETQKLLNEFYGRLAENVSRDEWLRAYKDMVTIGTGTVQIIHDEFSTFDPAVFDTLDWRIMRKEPE